MQTNHAQPSAPEQVDCVIVGAGPAGLSAAIYLRRFHRTIALLDAGHPRLLKVDQTHNVPGFPGGICGQDLLDRLRSQLDDCKGRIHACRVTSVVRDGERGLQTRTDGGQDWSSRTVLIATGALDIDPDIEGIADIRSAGLLRECPVCDGHEHSDQRIAVMGKSAHGPREAAFLRHFSPRVRYYPMSDEAAAPEWGHWLDVADVSWSKATVNRLSHEDRCLALHLADGTTEYADVLYSAAGSRPNVSMLDALNPRLDDRGNLVVDAHCHTGIEGLYAAGDVTTGLDQIVIAMAQGAIAATAIHNGLSSAPPARVT